jgi:Homeodomain-like domain
VTAKQIAVKRYVMRLSEEERERLDTLIHVGKHPARLLVKARILLKADASEVGEAWSDSQIAAALDTSVDTVARTRQQLVEEGFEAVLTRKHSPASAKPRIFDGAAEHAPAKAGGQTDRPRLFRTAKGSQAVDPATAGTAGRGVEHRRACQRQHDRADAKKTSLSRICKSNGSSHPMPMPLS